EGTSTDDNTKADKGLRNDNGGTMIVENCDITSSNWAVWNTGNSKIIISGGTFNGRYGMYNNSGTFELSGSPTFTGSTADIYLSNGQKITVTGTLGNAAPYSVLTATDPAVGSPVEITNNATTSYNDKTKFTSADGYAVRKNSNGQLELALLATYTITYDKGTPSNVTGSHNADTVAEGESVTLPGAVFTRTGYTQTGWSTSDGGAKVYELNETFSPDDNITLYPCWTANTYTVTFDYNGATDNNSTEKKEVTFDSTYGTLPTPTKTGYTFDGWFTAASGGSEVTSGTKVTITESQTLYAHWTANQYTVTFDYQGATSDNSKTSQTVTYDSTYGELPTPKKTGFSFGGWFTAANGQGNKVTADTRVEITAAQTLYASWVECQHEDMKWTADQDGKHHSGTCENCGKSVQNEHRWNDGEITLEPTAETEGEKLFTCTDCKATYTEVIPKHEHDFSGKWEGHDENGHWHVCPIDKATDTPVDHEWDDGKVTKPATEIEEGEMTYTCGDCGATKIEKIEKLPPTGGTGDGDNNAPSTGDTNDPSGGNGAGNVTVNSASGENAPDVSISEETSSRLKDEVIASHLTPEEKAAVENGADVDIILSVEDAGDTVPTEDKQVTKAVLTNTEYTLGMYLNIDLIKLINGQQVEKITELNTPIRVTIEIPKEFRSANRAFAIVRVHDGVAEVLEDEDNDPNTITIVTDKFSTYSIAYQDTEVSYSDDVNSNDTASDNPNTGAATPIAIAAIALAIIVAAVTVNKKKLV
ncbi:MAG: InlB B-repeat-containing protein, partial [Oscillospiraceae bacterium]|nr:InlB B-repeat-containing protein [Oscillospiraceae bacterium]